jgi:membrane-anchored protein YejM (alkaline phosphatase superfamily)
MLSRLWIAALALVCVSAAETRTKNVILITADGLRWQDLFTGMDPLLRDKAGALKDSMWKDSAEERRLALMPFFWGKLASRGVVLGNVNKNSSVKVTNGMRVSYPGYSEILTGRSQDEAIHGNDKIQNPTQTVLEFVREKLKLQQKQVALFASWDTFRFIGEKQPGSIVINAGYQEASGSDRMRELSTLQFETLTPWDSVRHDYITLQMALDHLRREKPRMIYIALGETDDWAHDRRYDRVLAAIQYFDTAIRQVFEFIDSSPSYRGKTSVVITSDHGRGSTLEDWHGHGAKVSGADQIWMAVIGPDTQARGEVSNSTPIFQRDAAPTILKLLGLKPEEYTGVAGTPIPY